MSSNSVLRSSRLRWLCSVSLMWCLTAGAASASAQTVKSLVWGQAAVEIAPEELETKAPLVAPLVPRTAPAYGTLEISVTGALQYVPQPEFWQHGFDSFEVDAGQGGHDVFLVATLSDDPLSQDLLAGCVLSPDWSILGEPGQLLIEDQGSNDECAMVLLFGGGSTGVFFGPQALTGPGGGNTSITLDPGLGGLGPSGDLSQIQALDVPIAMAMTDTGQVLFELRLQGGMQLVARAYRSDGTSVSSTPVFIGAQRQRLSVDWWFASTPGAGDGGMLVFRDEVLVSQVRDVDNFALLDAPWSWRFGILAPTPGKTGGLAIIGPRISISSRRPVAEPIFADSATTGTTERWSRLIQEEAISIVPDMLTGDPQYRLALTAAEQAVALVDQSPRRERHYRARFAVGLDDLATGSGAWTLLSAPSKQRDLPLFRVEVRFDDVVGSYQMRSLARSGDQERASPWVYISSAIGLRDVSVQWWNSETTGHGGLRLWFDGELISWQAGLDNGRLRVDEIQFGAQGDLTGWAGVLSLDDILSWH